MNDLLLAPTVLAQLMALAKDPPHALLLVGPAGFGKRTLAYAWASEFATPEVVEPDEKNTLSIETVRSLYRQTRTRKEGRQVVIIDHAEAMGIEAQNAFLKLLEEPRPGVTFILTTPTLDVLLPTVASRAQTVWVRPLPAAQLTQWAKKQKQAISNADLVQFLFIAQGRPGVLATLLTNPDAVVAHRALMQQAKILLAADAYERLSRVNELTKDRPTLIATLEAMGVMVRLQLAKNNDAKWFKMADALELCLSRLAQNGNPRAQLTNFFLSY